MSPQEGRIKYIASHRADGDQEKDGMGVHLEQDKAGIGRVYEDSASFSFSFTSDLWSSRDASGAMASRTSSAKTGLSIKVS